MNCPVLSAIPVCRRSHLFVNRDQRIDDIFRFFGNGTFHRNGDDRGLFVGYETFDFMLVELRYYAQVAFGDPDRAFS